MELAVAKGASREALAARSGIDPAELKNQDNRIPFVNYVALMRAAKELTNDPALALHYGEAVSIREFSIVGLVGQSGETPSDALTLVNRYARLDVEVDLDGADRLQFVQRHGKYWLVDNRRNANDFPELTESGFARMVCDARRLGIATPVREVHVTHAAPSYRAEYERIFQAPIVFSESTWNALQLDDKLLTYRNAPQPQYLSGLLSERAEVLLAPGGEIFPGARFLVLGL